MIIECRDLLIGYEGKPVAPKLNFGIEKGDYVCIVGENGAGKTTLMKTLLGLKPKLDGEIRIDADVKNSIGYVPQLTQMQKDFPASVYEVVLSGALSLSIFKPFYSKRDKEKAIIAMEKMGLKDLHNRCYRELSGGQQKRVMLARAMVNDKKVLFMDEPTAGLDPMVIAEMYELIGDFNQSGMTIVMISHDIHKSLEYANKILHVGANVFWGTNAEYLNSPIGQSYLVLSGEKNDR
ncbi:MAG: ABC transporter ATP-binding protein [Ezakiella sp.]|nr:ABC transporter ATP-binding protein [Ezakiella sp.]